MQSQMTKARALTLAAGVVALCFLSWWRLSPIVRKTEGLVLRTAESPLQEPAAPSSENSAQRQGDSEISFHGRTMGTTYSVKYIAPPDIDLTSVPLAVQGALNNVDMLMSTYNDTSEVSLFNAATTDVPVTISAPLMAVLQLSKKLHAETGGAFDITVRPLVRAYGFGSGAAPKLPSAKTLKHLEQLVGSQWLKLGTTELWAAKSKEGVEIDLGGIAKGYGVDEAARALEALKIENYLVEVGGEIRFRGTKSSANEARKPWTLAIEEPDPSARRLHGILQAPHAGAALATSGDYRNFRSVNGQVLSHTFDPRKGKPVPRRTASVSVVRPSAAEADGLATALTVLDPEEAIALANEKKWAVYLLVHRPEGGFEPMKSKHFSNLTFERVESVQK